MNGRFYIVDPDTGRKFCVEPVRNRDEKEDETVFTNGGIDTKAVKNKSQVRGGAIAEKDSIITEENGYKDIVTIGPFRSPTALINAVCKSGKSLMDLA